MNGPPPKMNPFPGLRPFTQEEDYLFFGREEQTIELLQRLSGNRFVAVVGTSGSGKSSLVRCGLLSELLGGKMREAGAAWEIAVTHPGGNPLALLTDALIAADLYDPEQEHVRENLLATLSRSHFGLVEAIKQSDLPADTNFLLVVDQFEEVFRFHEAGQMQQEMANEFVSLLLEAVAQSEVPIYVVLTMRSDFIGECGEFEGLAEMVNRGEFLIPRLSREQYKRVIEGPIKVAGGQIAPRLLQRLLNDLGQQADQLPCLQHALMRTWNVWAEKGDADALDLDDYQTVGKMTQALSLHADEIYDSLASDRQRGLCRGMFQALTVQESENRGIRRPQRLGRLCQILEVPAEELLPIIDAYRQSGVTFLMPPADVELTHQTIIDISHESLMRVWTRLRHWVEEESQAAGIYLRLSESAGLYEHGKTGLYRDPELGIALAWREAKQPNAAWAERYDPGFAKAIQFLEASQQASAAEEQAREAGRQRELQQAQRLAEAQQLRLEHQQRSARILRIMLAGLAMVAIVAGAACFAALVAHGKAKQLATLARQKQEDALQSAFKAEQSAQEANRQRAAAQLAEQAMERTATTAAEERDVAQRESYRATIRLAESMLQGDDNARFQVADVLWDTKPELRGWEWGHLMAHCPLEEWSFQTDESGLKAVSATADGRFLVTAGSNDMVSLWDVEARAQVWQEKTTPFYKLVVDPRSRLIAISGAGDSQPQFRILDLINGKVVHESEKTGKADIAFNATGDEIFVLDDQATLQCIRTSTWTLRVQTAVAARPTLDNNRLFADEAGGYVGIFRTFGENSEPKFHFFDGRTLHPASELRGFREQVANVASPSTPVLNSALGELVYSFVNNVFRKTLDGRRRLVCDSSDYIEHLAFDPVSGSLLAATAKGVVRIIDADGGARTIMHGAPIAGLAALPRGRFVTAGADGLVKCWKLAPSDELVSKISGQPKSSSASAVFVEFASDGRSLLFRTWDRHNFLYEIDSLNYRQFVYPDRAGNNSLFPRFRPQANELVADSNEGLLLFPADSTGVDAESIRSISISMPHQGRDRSAAFDAAGRILVVKSREGHPVAYDLASQEFLPQPDVQGTGSVAISPDGLRALLRTTTQLQVWETSSGRLLNSLEVENRNNSRQPAVFHPDGELIAVVDGEKIILWDSNLGQTHSVIAAEAGSDFGACQFSTDGNRLFVRSNDQKIRVLDWKLGQVLFALSGGKNVDALAVSPDGLTIAYAGFSPSLFIAKSLPWQGEVPRDKTFYRAVDDLRLFTVKTARTNEDPTLLRQVVLGLIGRPPSPEPTEENARIAELLGDVARRQERYDDAVAEYEKAVTIRKQIVLKDPSKAALQGKLATAWRMQLAGEERHELAAVTETLQQAVTFWRELVQNPDSNPAGWQHLLSFQLALLDHQVAFDKDDAGELLSTAFSFWTGQSAAKPSDRFFRYGVSECCRRLPALYPSAAETDAIDHLVSNQPDLIAVIAETYAALGDWKSAIAVYGKGISEETTDADLLASRARAYEQLQEWAAAAADWERVVATDIGEVTRLSEFMDRLLLGGQAELAETVRANARSSLARRLDSEPENPQVAQVLADLLLSSHDTKTLLPTSESEGVAWLTTTTRPPANWASEDFDDSSWQKGFGVFGTQSSPGVDVRTVWTTNDIWLRRTFEWEPPATEQALVLRLVYDDAVEVYFNGRQVAGLPSWTPQYIAYLLDDSAARALHAGTNTIAVHCHQNSGGQHIDVGVEAMPYARRVLQSRFAAMKMTDPWGKLAAAYHLVGDQPALDRLLESHRDAVAAIGDLHAAQQNWERAITEYSKLITDETTDAALLLKRAEAYFATERRDLARADWQRAFRQQPELAQREFDQFKLAERWSAAAEVGLFLIDQRPDDTMLWVQVPPIAVLSEDEATYGTLCRRILELFRESPTASNADRAIKGCLLKPGAIDIADLPLDKLPTSLDDATPAWLPPWFWGTRALLAYRSGDAESAVKYVAQSEDHQPNDHAHAFNLSLLAMAQHELKHSEEARDALKDATQLIENLQLNDKNHHDVLIARILQREAETLINGSAVPNPADAAAHPASAPPEAPPEKESEPDSSGAGNDK